ncbi:hypothetical protein Fcan01_11214 [Folsomia candida]|uniref:Uncharacterized protein n=1 Tax=Folsomia candida TaxID=158441 RepID=A0A226EDG1_FOLCA|nr:hypothetical protein Fcan01_11214 [Folsomia candida]
MYTYRIRDFITSLYIILYDICRHRINHFYPSSRNIFPLYLNPCIQQDPYNFISSHSLLVYNVHFNFSLPPGAVNLRHMRVSVTRSLYQTKFCWTYVLPELKSNRNLTPDPLEGQELFHIPIFPPGETSYNTQIIWISLSTKVKKSMEYIYNYVFSLNINSLGNYEFYVVTETLHFYQLNRYHEGNDRTTVGSNLLQKFEKYSVFKCSLQNTMECFQSLENIANHVSSQFTKLNWIYENWWDQTDQTYTKTFVEMQNVYFSQQPHPNWIQVANKSNSFQDFLAYTIFAETLMNWTHPTKVLAYKNMKKYYGVERIRNTVNGDQLILMGSQRYAFLSCYGIKRDNSSYLIFINPFDKYIWACIVSVGLLFMVISWVKTDMLNFDLVIILPFAVLLEIYVGEVIKKTFSSKPIHFLFWSWILASITLTSFYKDVFTTEVILPYKRSLEPRWKTW